jgi:hypothetical protein
VATVACQRGHLSPRVMSSKLVPALVTCAPALAVRGSFLDVRPRPVSSTTNPRWTASIANEARPPRRPRQPLHPAAAAVAGLAAATLITVVPITLPAHAFSLAPPTAAPALLTASETSVIELFQKASKSVVNVTTYSDVRPAFSLNQEEMPLGAGSGMVWDKNGHIVTNLYVPGWVERKGACMPASCTARLPRDRLYQARH